MPIFEVHATHTRPFKIQMPPTPRAQLTDEEFFEFCRLNQDLRIERTSTGELIIMPPAGGETGRRNLSISTDLGLWARKQADGVAFDSSTGFVLPNGAVRSPDAAWIRQERWQALSDEQKQQFPPLCPDFVIELRSPSDRLGALQEKMQEYVANGTQLGWLIDPDSRSVYVYTAHGAVEHLEDLDSLSGSPLLKGFELNLTYVWA